jgi:hypothetical protein
VWLEETETSRGTFETLEIGAADGTSVLVQFEAGITPEMLDGYP